MHEDLDIQQSLNIQVSVVGATNFPLGRLAPGVAVGRLFGRRAKVPALVRKDELVGPGVQGVTRLAE